MKNIAILFGGLSTEHEVSLSSGSSIIEHINKDKYNILPIGIKKNGQWFLLQNYRIDDVRDGKWSEYKDLEPCTIVPSRHAITLLNSNKDIYVDCVFPVLHGKNGEDGTVQGLLHLSGIPYVGCGVLQSASCMDKSFTKEIISHTYVHQAEHITVHQCDFLKSSQNIIDKILLRFNSFPLFVKPSSSGSSVGAHKASDIHELKDAIEDAMNYDNKVLVEEAINGIEIEVAVLGNSDPIASTVGEITPMEEFYSYSAKYQSNTSELHIPARISEDIADKVRKAAITVYKKMGCTGLSRVDFFYDKANDRMIFNEINTMPGFTSISMYPKLFEFDGINYSQLIDRLIELAEDTKG